MSKWEIYWKIAKVKVGQIVETARERANEREEYNDDDYYGRASSRLVGKGFFRADFN